MPSLLPETRWALTPPFHPSLPREAGGLLSVALSLGSPRAEVIRRLFTVEPGLSSTGQAPPRPPGRLTGAKCAFARRGSTPGQSRTNLSRAHAHGVADEMSPKHVPSTQPQTHIPTISDVVGRRPPHRPFVSVAGSVPPRHQIDVVVEARARSLFDRRVETGDLTPRMEGKPLGIDIRCRGDELTHRIAIRLKVAGPHLRPDIQFMRRGEIHEVSVRRNPDAQVLIIGQRGQASEPLDIAAAQVRRPDRLHSRQREIPYRRHVQRRPRPDDEANDGCDNTRRQPPKHPPKYRHTAKLTI